MQRGGPKVSVRFIRKNAPYNVNEIAGFPPEVAKRFVDQKRAVYNVPESEKPADDEPVKEEAAAASPEPAPKPKAAPRKKKPAAAAAKKKPVAKSKK